MAKTVARHAHGGGAGGSRPAGANAQAKKNSTASGALRARSQHGKANARRDADDDDDTRKRQKRELVSVKSSHGGGDEDDAEDDDAWDDGSEDDEDDDDEDDGDAGEGADNTDEGGEDDDEHVAALRALASTSSGRKSLLVKHLQAQIGEGEGEDEDEDEDDNGEDGQEEDEGQDDGDDDAGDGDGADDEKPAGSKAVASRNGAADGPIPKNKQRVLLIASRGITHRFRHLMNEFHLLMPHSKKDAKLDSKSHLEDLNELAELNNCNNCVYFETRRHQDMYMWMSKTPNGPSVRFMVRNVHTMDELKMTGNCLKGSRPILSFDKAFDGQPHLQLLREMFVQTFGVPRTSRKIKPFIDHIMSFSVADNKIWLRNFQIVEKPIEKGMREKPISLVEIGPRCVLDIIRIFDGSFGGTTLYENPHFISPNDVRRTIKAKITEQHRARIASKEERDLKKLRDLPAPDPFADVFA